jgi:outer membrane protein assembly factor BamB
MLFAICFSLAFADFVKPPLHRSWTALTNDSTQVHEVIAGRIVYSSEKQLGVLDLKTGRRIWQKNVEWRNAAVITGNELVVLSQGDKRTKLLRFSLANGSTRKVADLPEDTRGLAAGAGKLFLLQPGPTVVALESQTGKPVWRKLLTAKKSDRLSLLSNVSFANGMLFVGVDGLGFHGIDPATGKVLWRKTPKYRGYEPQLSMPAGLVTSFDGVELLNPRTGNVKWSHPEFGYFQPKAVIGDVLIGDNGGQLVAIHSRSGALAWRGEPSKDNSVTVGGDDTLAPTTAHSALLLDKELMEIDKAGNVLWREKPIVTGRPIFADSQRILCNDGERVLCYVRGERPPLPKDPEARRRLAEKMVAEYELLDDTEQQDVIKLAPYATPPLIKKYAQWAIDNREGGLADKQGRGMRLYGLLSETARGLSTMVRPEDTDVLLAALHSIGPDNSYRGELVQIAGAKGDPAKIVPILVEQLKSNPPKEGTYSNSGAALEAVANSNHPTAVRFMIDALNDPKAPSDWRHEAFVHLAGTGGEEGVAAVLGARAKRGPRSTWEEEFMAVRQRRKAPLSEKTDAQGRSWRLVQDEVLGNGSDVFLQEKVGGNWSTPIFTGLFLGPTWTLKPPTDFRGVPVKEFVKERWIEILPDDQGIRKDSDGDGLSNLVEERLGTNPEAPDTDADGLNDSVDPCPNAAPRALGDREKIIAACLEARFFAQGWGVPAVIEVEGVAPFEMYGYDRPLLWTTADYKGTLPKMYNTGVNTLSMEPAVFDPEAKERPKDWLKMGADGKTAIAGFRRYSGGLNGEGYAVALKKVGDEWLVVNMRMMYIS